MDHGYMGDSLTSYVSDNFTPYVQSQFRDVFTVFMHMEYTYSDKYDEYINTYDTRTKDNTTDLIRSEFENDMVEFIKLHEIEVTVSDNNLNNLVGFVLSLSELTMNPDHDRLSELMSSEEGDKVILLCRILDSMELIKFDDAVSMVDKVSDQFFTLLEQYLEEHNLTMNELDDSEIIPTGKINELKALSNTEWGSDSIAVTMVKAGEMPGLDINFYTDTQDEAITNSDNIVLDLFSLYIMSNSPRETLVQDTIVKLEDYLTDLLQFRKVESDLNDMYTLWTDSLREIT